MANGIFTSTIATAIEETIDEVITDETKNVASSVVFPKWMQVGRMSKAIKDDVEYGGPGLLHEKPEGMETAVATINEGYTKRYLARTYGRRMLISEEAIEDNEYERVTQPARRLTRAGWKTAEYDAHKVLIRGYDTAYPGGDGVPLWSASHTLPAGGTWSNVFGTPMSPSRAAFVVGRAQVRKYPSQDGLIEGYQIKKVVCPVEQESEWEMLLGSERAPEAGEFNAINVLAKSRSGITLVATPFWSNTSTQWAFLTDCEYGIKFLWRRKFKSVTWVENSRTVMQHQITARWSTGWSDARCTLGSQA